MRAAVYARVSTLDQEPENQLAELRRYVEARGWTATEYIDRGVSGAKDRRPALDALLKDVRRHRFQAVVVWSLDRFGRSLAHVVATVTDLHERGIAFISLREGIDLSTAAGRLQLHIMAALAEFERERLRERTIAGLRRAKASGKRLGRRPVEVTPAALEAVVGLSNREAAARLGVSLATFKRLKHAEAQKPLSVGASAT
jgi:DNA invertase Pin-like site-specific DNA recombinase